MSAHRLLHDLFLDGAPYDIPDPGDGESIVVDRQFGRVQLESSDAETRTLPVPEKENIQLLLYMQDDGGDITLTATNGYNENGDTTITFSAEGQFAHLISVKEGDNFRWRLIASDGVSGPGLSIDGTQVTATAAEINRTSDVSGRLVAAGSSLSLTEDSHDGKTILLDTAAGTTITLPAATGSGARFRFIVSTTPTSNQHRINVVGDDAFYGSILGAADGGDTVVGWEAGPTNSDADRINLNGTTQGGRKGDWIEVEDVAADSWAVRGNIVQSGTEATPFVTGAVS